MKKIVEIMPVACLKHTVFKILEMVSFDCNIIIDNGLYGVSSLNMYLELTAKGHPFNINWEYYSQNTILDHGREKWQKSSHQQTRWFGINFLLQDLCESRG